MPGARMETKLWLWQRMSAAVLALCVVVHLAAIVMAVQGGLSAAEIIGRVSGSYAWLVFYSVFVLAVSLHAPIGVRTILKESTSLGPRATHMIMGILCLVILIMGFRAIFGLFFAGGAA